jgi:hypothetical protein
LKFQEETKPFPMNVIDFEGKKVLIWPGTTDKGKGKEVIIGNARKADGNNKIYCRKVVGEKTPDRGETLKVTITNAGGNRKQVTERGNLFCASWTVWYTDADSLIPRQTVWVIPVHVWQRQGATATTYLQTTTTRNRYVEN